MRPLIPATVFILLLTGLLCSCREFIEPSLEDEKVFLNAPADSSESIKYLQSFWWEPVEDALSYRLQIVTPSFDRPEQLLLDSVVKDNKFSVTLDPGQYQWRVRAENGSSQSLYSTRSFTIYPSSITSQQVQLKTPANGLVTNEAGITYSWYSLYGAARYRLQIDSTAGNFTNESTLFYNGTTPNTELALQLGRDNVYKWRVKAETDTSESKWSQVYSVTRDVTKPTRVGLNSPANNQSVSSPVNLQWNAIADAKKYQLYVSRSNDSTNVYSSSFPVTLIATSYSFSPGVSGELIYWKVRAIDAAGNTGDYSEWRSFSIQ